MADFESEVRQFIADRFLFGDDKQLGDSESLLDASIVDSTGILEIVAYLEGHYGIKVDNEELIPENLDTIANIGAFLRKKTS
jgi:acyl carrier protein